MDKFLVRRAVSIFISANVGWSKSFYNQSQLADYLGVRPATVSSWVHRNSDIDLFTFQRISQVFSVKRKIRLQRILLEFQQILEVEFSRCK